MKWFISQAIYDPEPMIQLLNDYGALCRKNHVQPSRVVLTFAPCGREKTMQFIKWLGVTVPLEVERAILDAEDKVGKSVDLLTDMCKTILERCAFFMFTRKTMEVFHRWMHRDEDDNSRLPYTGREGVAYRWAFQWRASAFSKMKSTRRTTCSAARNKVSNPPIHVHAAYFHV